jgi:hypothetical protein
MRYTDVGRRTMETWPAPRFKLRDQQRLAVVIGFIGVKLILETLHHEGVGWAPEIPILVSLGVIVGTLTITVVASLVRSRIGRAPVPADGLEEPVAAGADGPQPG